MGKSHLRQPKPKSHGPTKPCRCGSGYYCTRHQAYNYKPPVYMTLAAARANQLDCGGGRRIKYKQTRE